MLQLGEHRLRMVSGGDFRLDGGAMHGVVPKTIWSKLVGCDELNRVTYSTNCLVVDTPGGERVLVETGNGDKFSAKERAIYGIEQHGCLLRALAAESIAPESIDVVVMTHLHFDHAGGTTVLNGGAASLAFPRAEYWLQRSHWNWAHAPSERDRRSFRASEYELLESSGQLRLLDRPTTLFDVVHLTVSDGHTRGLQIPRVESGGQSVVFPSDLIPTVSHLNLPWIAAYDLEPMKVLEEKRALLRSAVENGWSIFFEHDPNVVACTLRRAANGEAEVAATEAF